MMNHERSRLRTIVAALGAVVAGIGFLYLSQQFHGKWYERLLNDLGSIIIVSVALVLVFDLWQKEAFFAELLKTARASAQLSNSGLSGFFESFHDGVDWDEIFKRSTHLDIVFAYGATWRNTHAQRLERMLAKEKAKVRVVLPRVSDSIVIAELAQRFSLDSDELVRRIEGAHRFFGELNARFPQKVEVFAVSRSLTYSSYRFNNDALLVLYNHRNGRHAVPTFVCTRGGGLYEFIRTDFYGVIETGVAAGVAERIDLTRVSTPPAMRSVNQGAD